MSRRRDRVVGRLQLRLLGDRPTVDVAASLASQITELEGRVAKLHRFGAQYTPIRVSRHVQHLREAAVAGGHGGHRVAKEV